MRIEYTKTLSPMEATQCIRGVVYRAVGQNGNELGFYLCAEITNQGFCMIDLDTGLGNYVKSFPTWNFIPVDAEARITNKWGQP